MPDARGRLAAVRTRLRPRSLRTRLIVVVTALLAAVCLIIGVVSQIALHGFLTHQLDEQLAAASGRARAAAGPHPGQEEHPPPRNLRFPPGQQTGTVTARIVDGTVRFGALLDTSGRPLRLTDAQAGPLTRLRVGDHPVNRDLGTLGEYRLVAVRLPDGAVQVTGLPLASMNDTLYRLAVVEAIVAAIALIAAGFAGAVVIRLTLRPLRRVAATASRVTELPLDRGDVALPERVPDTDTDTRTEVGRVGAALNRLLGHVQAALRARQASETRVRRFVADASHELRTPLAAIRGYAELTRRRRTEAPPDIAHAMRRVESEAVRMTALVDDLLLLAKLDSGRPLAREPVDLSQLTVDAVSDAHVAGREYNWRLDLPEEPVVVTGDAARLHQVLANLLANARAHTPPDTTVTTALSVRDGSALLTVTDDGPGIPADLLPEIFERFARGDASRTRDGHGGTGLGLAIVAAVVESHHGTVRAESEQGRTAFVITLPLDPDPPD